MSEILVERSEEARTTSAVVLLGNEAVALGALHAGISAAYGYPGTPSTEILEFLQARAAADGRPVARWCANEKTAYEAALGVVMVGKRALVSMKHVGLNVAADPFVNSALLGIHAGLVVVSCDDPGMHSSQNEQDSRHLADFARILCLEPADQQEAFDMARAAFDLSERFALPVMVRLVTRLAHSRAGVLPGEPPAPERTLRKPEDPGRTWTLLPSIARAQWRRVLRTQRDLRAWAEESPWNTLRLDPGNRDFGIVTAGIGRNYYLDNLNDPAAGPSHLHIGTFPIPAGKVRDLARHVRSVLVIEDGYPIVERMLRGVLTSGLEVWGKETGHLPGDGELTPDLVRKALNKAPRESFNLPGLSLPPRPPQLCQGCPHRDSYAALHRALEGFPETLVAADIGCYTLGALPPFQAIESCVCMGASIGMAKGASDAGFRPAVAVLGDSTFLHSGVTPLMDAVAADADMTVLILDNGTVGMTGTQETVLPSGRIREIVLGVGVPAEHCRIVDANPHAVDAMAKVLREEIDHRGISVVIARRECLESLRRHRAEKGGRP
ncbi:MAG: indolepyruvate ferredoxin oxidoreductase [Planctomycetaceae bacterium]|nr:thiamine pyrophosphate-dependent enzyme [Planctomycetota bacterium]NUN51475.1 indolepyruvate ferredoxin oxidoreductase [Planctomycetaceae bacterium]